VVAEPRYERRARVRAGRNPLGAIVVPEIAANLCFGGHHHNRLFICASTSIYAMDVGTRGVEL
jgi:sugar lactone lactonase YvrE